MKKLLTNKETSSANLKTNILVQVAHGHYKCGSFEDQLKTSISKGKISMAYLNSENTRSFKKDGLLDPKKGVLATFDIKNSTLTPAAAS